VFPSEPEPGGAAGCELAVGEEAVHGLLGEGVLLAAAADEVALVVESTMPSNSSSNRSASKTATENARRRS
jgi:hypothetical protein